MEWDVEYTDEFGSWWETLSEKEQTAVAVTAAILEASRWIDASLANRRETAETIAAKAYVNTDVDVIRSRMIGQYENGLGKSWSEKNHMKFYNDGAVNFPYLSDGMWFMTQHKRWGMLKDHPDYLAVAKKVNQIALYKEAAAQLKVPLPKSELRESKLIDGVVWNAKDPKAYADGFKIKG